MKISQSDMDDIMLLSARWKASNTCGRCWHGPCMCEGVKDTRDKIVPAGRSESTFNYRGMSYTNPIARRMIDADTAKFCGEMQAEVKAGIERRRRAEEC